MKNNKNTVTKSIVSIGFDKNGKIQSFVNGDRIIKMVNNIDNISALIREVDIIKKYMPTKFALPANIKKVPANVKKVPANILKTPRKSKVAKSVTLNVTKNTLTKLYELISKDNQLQAIKLVNDETGWGLKESMKYVNLLIENLRLNGKLK